MRKKRIFWGLFLILSAIALIVSKLGYFSEVNVFTLVATVFLVAIVIKSIFKMNFAGILFPIAFIGILFDNQLGITAITPWTILIAALLGSIGFSILFKSPKKWSSTKFSFNSPDYNVIDAEDESHIKLESSFSDSIKYVNTDKLEQVDIRCRFGAIKVYFDNATLNEGNGILRLDASFSGVELYIPKTWTVVNRANVSLGGIEEKNRNMSTGNNILTLVGDVSFAGVEITYI